MTAMRHLQCRASCAVVWCQRLARRTADVGSIDEATSGGCGPSLCWRVAASEGDVIDLARSVRTALDIDDGG